MRPQESNATRGMEDIYDAARDPYYALVNDGGSVKGLNFVKDGIGDNGPKLSGLNFGAFEIGAGGVRFGAVRGGNDPVGQNPDSDTVPGNNSSTETIVIGAAAETGYINTNGDQDWFRVELEAGQYYEFTMDPGGSLDAVLQLRASTGPGGGTILATSDGPGAGDTEVLGFYATTSGTYFLNADGFSSTTGSYTIRGVEAELPDIRDTIDWGGATVANPEVIHVYFAQAGEIYDGVTSLGWNSYEMQQAMLAFGVYEDIINVSYVQTTNAAEADFKLVTTTSSSYLGYFNPPGTDGAGIGVFARNGTGWDENGAGGLEQGGYGWITMIHEFGHGMGLAHPHDNGGGSDVLLGVTDAFDSYGLFDLNQGVWTTMSYNDGWATGPNGSSPSTLYGYQGTMMALDIAVLQEKYGANTSFNTGDNTYVMDTANAAGTYYASIWDAGGNDTISFAGSAAAVIDLRAATIDYSAGGGGYMSYATGIFGGFTIAQGVLIENATGGSGNDSITGNEIANTLKGNGGADVIRGGQGADIIEGGAGNDTFHFAAGDGHDLISDFVAGAGDDRIEVTGFTSYTKVQEGSDLRIVFDASNSILLWGVTAASFTSADINIALAAGPIDGTEDGETLTGTEDADTINGLGGNDSLIGLGGGDTLNGGEGNDRLIGGLGNDTLNGGNGTDQVDYRNSATAVTVNLAAGTATGEGSDTLSSIENAQGSAFADTLTGDAGANSLNGHSGNDTLDGGLGNDTLIGGAGADAINGGAGLDYASYINAAAGVSVNLATNVHTGEAAGDTFTSVERFRLSAHADTFQGAAGTNYAYGAEGDDTLSGGAGFDRLYGEEGWDQLFGEADNDVLIGGAGGDDIDGGGGKDGASYETASTAVSVNLDTNVHTGDAAGDSFNSIEFFMLSGHNDTFVGGTGADEAQGGAGVDTLSGGDGVDWMRGQDGNDVLNGDGGDDTLEGGAGADAMDGGAGTDYASYYNAVSVNLTSGVHTGDAAGDTFTSVERFRLSGFDDTFFGSTGDDWVAGYMGNDTLDGGDGNDTLNGGGSSDILLGGIGNDKLIGEAGNDTLTGGLGADAFQYIAGGFGNDTITDYGVGADYIRVTGIAGVDDFGDLTVTQDGANAVITFPDGSTITLSGVSAATVDAADFSFG